MVAWPCLEFSLPSSFLWAFISDQTQYAVFLWSVWISCASCPFPRSFPAPAYWWWEKCWRDSAAAVSVLLSTCQNRGVLPTSFCAPKQSIALEGAAGDKMNSASPRPNTSFYSYAISVLSVCTLDFFMMTCNPENRHLLLRSPDT